MQREINYPIFLKQILSLLSFQDISGGRSSRVTGRFTFQSLMLIVFHLIYLGYSPLCPIFSDFISDQGKMYLNLSTQFHSFWSYHDLKIFLSHLFGLLHSKRGELLHISKANLVLLVIVPRYLRWSIVSH